MRKPVHEKLEVVEQKPMWKLDLGCGKSKREGFIGVDSRPFAGVDWVCDLSGEQWIMQTGEQAGPCEPLPNDCVEEAHCSHFIEHLTAKERIFFVNELYRVLIPGGKCTLVVPHWASCRAYGDLTHQWPPVSEFWFYYLAKSWREVNAPHNDGYTCDFDATWGYSMRNDLIVRNQEHQQFALQNYKEAAQDIIATLVKRVA